MTTLNTEDIEKISKEDIPQHALRLTASDVDFLIDRLSDKADETRYKTFLLLQANSRIRPYIYAHWAKLEAKLTSENSYQRSLGVMLIAESVRWDMEGKFRDCFEKYLTCCSDEKFVTSRQAIQGLQRIIEATGKYDTEIKRAIEKLPLDRYKESQQSLLRRDITATLKAIEKKTT